MDEIAQPVVQVERPEGVLRVAFVDGVEVVVSSDSLTVNRVEYSVMVRFKLDGEAWVEAGTPYVSRPGMRLDSGPSWSARRKIVAAAEQALLEALETEGILTRATQAHLQYRIAGQAVLLSQAEAKAAEIRRDVQALEQQQRILAATSSTASRFIFALGATDDDVMVCLDVVAQSQEAAVETLRGFLERRDPSDPFVAPGSDGLKELRFYLNAEPTEVDASLIEDCEELA